MLDNLIKENWTTSKTYEKTAPHEYIVREATIMTDEEFAMVVIAIRENGFPAWFWKSQYIYLYKDGYLYWTMNNSPEETRIINRCRIEDVTINIRSVI